MKVLIQRVNYAKVKVGNKIVGEIGRGLLVFLGVGQDDTEAQAKALVKKLVDERLFSQGDKKFELSLKDVAGAALVVSQFTLCGDCSKGRRPDFFAAAEPEKAKKLYEFFIQRLAAEGVKVAQGEFGAYMQVELENDGPVTFLVER